MSKYSIYDTASGVFSRFQADVALFVQPSESYVTTDDAVDPVTWSWDATAHSWTFDVAKARIACLHDLAIISAGKVNGGVAIAGVGTVRTSIEDRLAILSAFVVAKTMLEAGEDFTVPVDLADGSSVTLDAVETIDLGLAIAGAQGAILGRARTLKAAILAASDPTSVDIDSGW